MVDFWCHWLKGAYKGLAQLPNVSRIAHLGVVVTMDLLCGCSNNVWNYLSSYVLQDQDTLASISSRFRVSMQDIEKMNNITYPNFIFMGKVYYIPMNSGNQKSFMELLAFSLERS